MLQACLQGVEQGRWILVNVQNAQEFACQVLNRDVWSHIPIKQIIQSNFVFWQVGSLYCHVIFVRELSLFSPYLPTLSICGFCHMFVEMD